MRRLYRWCYLIGYFVILMLIFTGCKKNYYDSNAVNESLPPQNRQLYLDVENCELELGMSRQITVTQWMNDQKKAEFVYTSADDSIVKVDNTGLMTAKAVGETIVTVEATKQGFLPAQCRVVVTPLKKVIIVDDVPDTSTANKSYNIHIAFQNCNQPSLKIIANCGKMIVTVSNESVEYETQPIQLRTSGETQINFETSGNVKDSIRILCYNGSELIDLKEYTIYNESYVREYIRKNVSDYIDSQELE